MGSDDGDVTSCTGRLIRHFPGPAVTVERNVVTADNFLPELAHVLSITPEGTQPSWENVKTPCLVLADI